MTRTLRTLLASALLAALPTAFAEDAKPGEAAATDAAKPAESASEQAPQPQGYHFALTGPGDQPVTDASAPVKAPEKIQPVFISIDPLRDNSERLNQYTGYFDKRIVGLTGSMADIEATAKRYSASFGYRHNGKKVVPPDLPEGYTVYHSTMIYLISPERELIDAFDYQSGAEKLARDIDKAIAKKEGGAQS